MNNCKKCIHKNVCIHRKELNDFDVNHKFECADFKDENQHICLPADIGRQVWFLGQPCGGCPCYNEPPTEEFIKKCQQCKKWEIGQCDFDYELIPEFGKYVFLTKEEAENKLKELMENDRT